MFNYIPLQAVSCSIFAIPLFNDPPPLKISLGKKGKLPRQNYKAEKMYLRLILTFPLKITILIFPSNNLLSTVLLCFECLSVYSYDLCFYQSFTYQLCHLSTMYLYAYHLFTCNLIIHHLSLSSIYTYQISVNQLSILSLVYLYQSSIFHYPSSPFLFLLFFVLFSILLPFLSLISAAGRLNLKHGTFLFSAAIL